MLTIVKKYKLLGLFLIFSFVLPSVSFAEAKGYVPVSVNTPFVAKTNGFVVVKLLADTTERNVVAQGIVDEETVASASAADNEGSIISTATQSFTFPVRKGSNWEVDSTFGSSKVEVHWFTFGISL
ncbi:hypothetical protein [Methylocucumis oryzae]|uniref:Uncharacterized protein n=1 Tax=Methylocucumis oryzae TaxID=1632867 RepID=A0A0F3IKP8_9GAMM|nr:hypothetical protein [Methylocucumis oryzae]KJV07291.1 hypothetical protein VZ94_05770 [Methylocucumis oryzae]